MSSAGRAKILLHTGQVRSHLMAGKALLPWKQRPHSPPPPPSHTYRERTERTWVRRDVLHPSYTALTTTVPTSPSPLHNINWQHRLSLRHRVSVALVVPGWSGCWLVRVVASGEMRFDMRGLNGPIGTEGTGVGPLACVDS